MEMCITVYGTMENPIHSLWKRKSSFPTSFKQGFPQSHEHSQLYNISTMPAPTESIPLSISFLKSLFYRYIPAFSAKSDFRPISTDFFSSGRLSNTPLYPFSIKEVPYAIKYSFISSHSCHNPSNNALLSIKVSSSSKPCGGL